MGYLPIFLDVSGRKCMVVGGGEVATRKVESLLEADAMVTVVSKHLSDQLDVLRKRDAITVLERSYLRGDMAGCALVYAATDDAEVHRAIAVEARELGILLNVADVPELCTFIAPAIVKQGSLQIAISTGGASPAFAARMRRSLEAQFGIEYAHALRILRGARNYLKSQVMDAAERSHRLKALAESELLDALRMHDVAALERIVATCLGHEVALATLGIDPASLDGHGWLNASQ